MFDRRRKRVDTLVSFLEQRGPIHLKQAADMLDVSEMTVRRDIAEAKGSLAFYGGYIAPVKDFGATSYAMNTEEDRNASKKAAAGRKAASLVENGDTVFIDCGTTTPHIAKALPEDLELTVVCYSLNIANIVCKNERWRVIMLGGIFYPNTQVFKGAYSLSLLGQVAITKAFVSAGGVHEKRGLTCSNFYEVEVKQAVLRATDSRFVVVDSSKFSLVKPAFFAPLAEAGTIIADAVPEDYARVIESAGLSVLLGAD